MAPGNATLSGPGLRQKRIARAMSEGAQAGGCSAWLAAAPIDIAATLLA
jgi:hypothetical protein